MTVSSKAERDRMYEMEQAVEQAQRALRALQGDWSWSLGALGVRKNVQRARTELAKVWHAVVDKYHLLLDEQFDEEEYLEDASLAEQEALADDAYEREQAAIEGAQRERDAEGW